MSKKSKKKLGAWQQLAILNAAPTIKSEVRESAPSTYSTSGLAAFRHKYEQEQEEAREAPLRKVKTEHSRLLTQLIEQDRETGLYSAPSSFLAATTPQVGDGAKFANRSPEEIRATIRRVFSEFEDSLAEGKLTPSGKQKCQNIARANTECDPTEISTWQQIFTLLRQSGELLDQGDSDQPDFIVNEVADEPEQPAGLDEVLATNDSFSREGKRAIEAAALANMQGEAYDMFLQWSRLIYDRWGVILSPEQTQAVTSWFLKWNKSYLRHESWNECRRAMVKAQIFDSCMLLPDEILAERLENSNLNDRDARIEFAQESRRINNR